MMSAAYSMRMRLGGGAFSWSSRGPTKDGALGVSVCAPGGAVTSVARFTLRNSQLMNGTSMAAPHVAGVVSALVSGLKQNNLPYSPYSLKRALENSASHLSHVEPWAQGAGLVNVEKAYDLLSTYHNEPERDVTFQIQCGTSQGKGVLLRPKYDDVPKDIGITVEPQFLQNHNDRENKEVISRKIDFGVRLALSCNATWVSAPAHLDMMNASRPISVRIDTTGLSPGAHFTSINAFDVNCVSKGPVFRIPITVLRPEPLQLSAPGCPLIKEENVLFKPATIKRHFVIAPPEATWGVLKMTTEDKEKSGRFLVHTMQILPRKSCRCHETQKLINVNAEAPTLLPFQLQGGVPLEVVIAKYWANIGDIQVNYSIEFHGLKPDFGKSLVMGAAEGVKGVLLSSLRLQDVQPAAQLKYTEPVVSIEFHGLKPDFGKSLVMGAAEGVKGVLLSSLRLQDVQPAAQLKYTEPVVSIEFHGLKPDFGKSLVMGAAEGVKGVLLSSLRLQDVQPAAQLKYTEPVVSIEFHGLKPDFGKSLVLGAAVGVMGVLLSSLRLQDVQPAAQLKYTEPVVSIEFHGLKPDFGKSLVMGAAEGEGVLLSSLRLQDVQPAAQLKYTEPVVSIEFHGLKPDFGKSLVMGAAEVKGCCSLIEAAGCAARSAA
ncbi:subtilase family domain-containing protein [Phthorimaea operculella]|nr:subtilase family domain-containing protein [Phthorimaea operculella]